MYEKQQSHTLSTGKIFQFRNCHHLFWQVEILIDRNFGVGSSTTDSKAVDYKIDLPDGNLLWTSCEQ